MTIGRFIQTHNLEQALLIGYYGGGNYGDELLLEIMQNLLAKKGVKRAEVAYMPYVPFERYHHDFGYAHFTANSVPKLLGAIFRSKSVIIGGGGIWGLDAKLQPLLMSVALFIARWIFGKNVYLFGVGYYSSTNWYGHVGAFLAAISATVIIARDPETKFNFRRISRHVYEDTDLAWYLPSIDTSVYKSELTKLEADLPITRKTVFITLRRFSPAHQNDYDKIVGDLLEKYSDRDIVLALLEPRAVYPDGYKTIRKWQGIYPHVRAVDLAVNPVALYLFLQNHRHDIKVISPQFHAMLSAHLAGAPFLPLVYDNKCQALLNHIGVAGHSIYDLQSSTVQRFIDEEAP